jgi:hypothetical protein
MGKASAVNSMLQRFGSAFGVAVATAVFTANGGLGSPASFAAGFRPALVVVAGLSFLGALSALAVSQRRTTVATPAAALDTPVGTPVGTPVAATIPEPATIEFV